jgi:hypothetical protein
MAPPKGPRPLLPDEERCVHASRTSPDGRCLRRRQKESTECTRHGCAPQKQNAIARRQAAADAKHRAMVRLEKEGYPRLAGPEAVIDMLEDRMSVQYAISQKLDTIVLKLSEEDALRYEHRAGEQLRGEVQAWIQINQMVTKLGSDYLKIGLDERKVRLAEAQARILMGVIQAVLNRLELNSDQRKIAAIVVPEELSRAAIEQGDE